MSRKPLFSKAMPPAECKRRSRLGLAKPAHKKRSKGLGTKQTLAPSAPVGTAAPVLSERDDEIDRIVLDAACDELLRRFQEAMAAGQLGIADRRVRPSRLRISSGAGGGDCLTAEVPA